MTLHLLRVWRSVTVVPISELFSVFFVLRIFSKLGFGFADAPSNWTWLLTADEGFGVKSIVSEDAEEVDKVHLKKAHGAPLSLQQREPPWMISQLISKPRGQRMFDSSFCPLRSDTRDQCDCCQLQQKSLAPSSVGEHPCESSSGDPSV